MQIRAYKGLQNTVTTNVVAAVFPARSRTEGPGRADRRIFGAQKVSLQKINVTLLCNRH